MSTRYENNKKLVKILESLVESFPGQRMGQILRNFGFVMDDIKVYDENGNPTGSNHWRNEFMVEPDELLKRVTKTIEEFSNE